MTGWTEQEDAAVRLLASQGMTTREISKRLATRSRNAVIGYCNRHAIPLGKKSYTVNSMFMARLRSLVRDGQRCKRANNGCRDPKAVPIYRFDGTQCGSPGCHNNRIPYAKHGLCSIHNAGRLAGMSWKNRGGEINTSVPAGWMG